MKTLRTIAALIPVALLVGCTTSKVWYQEGRSVQETQKQLAECRAEKAKAEHHVEGMFSTDMAANHVSTRNYIKDCMWFHGYSLVDRNSLPPGAGGVPQ